MKYLALLIIAGCSLRVPKSALDDPPKPVIQNVRNNGLLQSGYIIGTATGADSVEVSYDGGAVQLATLSGTSWKVAIPKSSSGWKDGSVHTVKVNTIVNGNSQTRGSANFTQQIQVRKGVNKDINGDGYPDLVVGANSYNSTTITSNQGRVFIFHGSSTGVSTQGALSANSILSGELPGGPPYYRFGTKLALGDINGDGYADIIVGASRYNVPGVSTGRAYLFLGSSSGIATQGAASANAIISGEASGNLFGAGIVIGDINGDGYSDAVISGLNYGGSFGRAYIFYGSANGLATQNASAANNILTGAAADQLGYPVALGDINGDGYQDLIVGAGQYNAGTAQGRVYFFYGSATGIATQTPSVSTPSITGENTGDALASTITVGDINGDNIDDVALGAISYIGGGSQGRVYIFYGSTSGISTQNAGAAKAIFTGDGATDSYGQAIALSDFNGDGYADLAVSAPGTSSSTGSVYIFQGSASGLSTLPNSSAKAVIAGQTAGDQLGIALSGIDVNGDGYPELVTSATQYNAIQGRIYIFTGGSSGIATQNAGSANSILTGQPIIDSFGNGFGNSIGFLKPTVNPLRIPRNG